MAKYRSITVDIDIDDFEDDDLIAEIIDRHLVDAVLKRVGRIVDKPASPREHAVDALSHMMCRRPSAALHAIDTAIAAFVPVELLAARDALREGEMARAICEIEHYISPALSATIDPVNYAIMRRTTPIGAGDQAPTAAGASLPSAERSEDVNGQRQSCAPDASKASQQA